MLQGIGRRIRTFRTAGSVTQASAAARAGMDLKRWQKIERGAANVTVRTLVRMAEALGVSFWEVVGQAQSKRRGDDLSL